MYITILMAFCPTPFVLYQPQFSAIEDDNESVNDSLDEEEQGSKGSVGSLFACLKPSFTAMNSKKPSSISTLDDMQFTNTAAAAPTTTTTTTTTIEHDSTYVENSSYSTDDFNNYDKNILTSSPPPPQSPTATSSYKYQLPEYIRPASTLEKYDPTASDANNDNNDITTTVSPPRNQWSETPAHVFYVRGPTYLQDGFKVPSPSPALMVARGIDLFQISSSDTPTTNVGQRPQLLSGKLRCVPTFICNFRFPWGILVCYFEIPQRFLPFARYYGTIQPQQPPDTSVVTNNSNNNNNNKNDCSSTAMEKSCEKEQHLIDSMKGMPPGERAFAKFLMADQNRKVKTFKLIPVVVEGPWAARYAVTGKPVIIGNKLPIQFIYVPPSDGMAEYIECDLDVGHSSIMAKNIVTLCKRCTSELTIDFAFLVEGTSEDELPEHLMGAMRAYRLDPDHSPLFPGGGSYENNNNNTERYEEQEEGGTDDEFWDCLSN